MKRALLVVVCAALAGCGFHLRGAHEFALPARLSVMRVTMPASGLKYPGLVLTVRHALEDRGVRVVTQGHVPAVVLSGETMTPMIVTMSPEGGASAYLLDYAVTFSLLGAHGRVLIPPSVVRAQREYRFDPLNLPAMAREQAYLERRLRHSAARQIVWRLASYKRRARAH